MFTPALLHCGCRENVPRWWKTSREAATLTHRITADTRGVHTLHSIITRDTLEVTIVAGVVGTPRRITQARLVLRLRCIRQPFVPVFEPVMPPRARQKVLP